MVTTLVLACAQPAAAQCYQLPFSNPNVADGWHRRPGGGHRGVDFPQPTGTPIPAVAAGIVRQQAYDSCLGNVVVVQHDDGMYSGYCHMQAPSPLAEGTRVAGADIVGAVGATGTCQTGPHLHLTISDHEGGYYSGTTVDPLVYIAAHAGGGAETCNGVDDDCDGIIDEGELCELALLHDQPAAYATPTTTDVDADGLVDLCARGGDGLRCWTSTGIGWNAPWEPIPWSNELGWDDVTQYATLRMGDLNADGRADVCARSDTSFLCALSNGAGFDAVTAWREDMSDASGWNLPQHYTTIRLADVDADGKDDLCALDAEGFGCWLSNGTAFDQRVEGPRWSAELASPKYYGTLRTGDLNADDRADVCIRGAAGVQCALSDGAGFPTSITGPEWNDATGFGALQYWSTIRLADVDGDGRDDLCTRTSTDLRCVLATADGFGETVIVAGLSDAGGWADRTNYSTLRVGDVDGDGADDFCGRANAAMVCWAWDGSAFVERAGPEWSDASGWGAGGQYYQTIRLADFDADGMDDLCARAGAGWRCHPSDGAGFGDGVAFDELTDAGNWNEHRYWSTILSGGRACHPQPERCNGRNDDCDGAIDEGVCTPDAGVAPARDAAVPEVPEVDGGAGGGLSPGCGCRAAPSHGGTFGLGLSLLLGLGVTLRRRTSKPGH